MFKRKKEKQQEMVDTIIATDTVVEGKIIHPKSLRIDGKVYGAIKCEGDVYIGKTGFIEPSVTARNVYIAGEIDGNVHATEKIHIQPSGTLEGKSKTKGLIIDEGGSFSGESIIINGDESLSKIDPNSSDEKITSFEDKTAK